MSTLGQITKSDFIPINIFKQTVDKLENDRKDKLALYFLFSVATALRVGDVLSTKWCDIIDSNFGTPSVKARFVKIEQKTGKRRIISFSESTNKRILCFYKKLGSPELNDYMFPNNKQTGVLSKQYLNAELKRVRNNYDLPIQNFSTHSFRKTFSRNFWESNNRSSDSLILLMDILNHSSLAMTKKYLGITDEEISNAYTSLNL